MYGFEAFGRFTCGDGHQHGFETVSSQRFSGGLRQAPSDVGIGDDGARPAKTELRAFVAELWQEAGTDFNVVAPRAERNFYNPHPVRIEIGCGVSKQRRGGGQ